VNLVALRNHPSDDAADDDDMQFMGNLLGAIEFSPSDFTSTCMENVGAKRKLYVADLCIRQDARRIGVATSLLQYVESFALSNLYNELYLHVEVDNIVARNLYIKNGYLEVDDRDLARAFTMERLHKPPDTYVMLWKSIGYPHPHPHVGIAPQ
jgi:ribosomal protein S18 acetylase RimI-like enzyme